MGKSVTALVCGILNILLFWIPIVGFVLAVIAVIFGAMAVKDKEIDGRGMGIAGFVLGIIGLVFNIPLIILFVIALSI